MTTPESRDTSPVERYPDDSRSDDRATAEQEGRLTEGTSTGATGETSAAHTTETDDSTDGRLLPQEAVVDLRARWEAVQQGFVDDPRSAVSDADRLVGEVLQTLSATFEDQHRTLETQWSEGEPDTEDLRSALQRYRAFFNRLLSI